jgi:hypothetical protein
MSAKPNLYDDYHDLFEFLIKNIFFLSYHLNLFLLNYSLGFPSHFK